MKLLNLLGRSCRAGHVGEPPNNHTGIEGQGLTLGEARSHVALWVAPLRLALVLRTTPVEVQSSQQPPSTHFALASLCIAFY
jgi:hypothetical protein